MDESSTEVYHKLLIFLSRNTKDGIRHRFITTNWDYLLQKAIDELNLKVLPKWLDESWVFHLNGSVEDLPDNSRRSPFLLESDEASTRIPSVEANAAYGKLIWSFKFIVVGMSFECQIDKGFLAALNRVEDDLPIGFSQWIIVNSNPKALEKVEQNLRVALPRCRIETVCSRFEEWIYDGMPILREKGFINALPRCSADREDHAPADTGRYVS